MSETKTTTKTTKTTHDWARQLHETAEFLLSRPEVEIGRSLPVSYLSFYGDKVPFLAVVRATLPGKKEIDQWNVNFHPKGVRLQININRDAVCRKVQDVKYECEPLLSQEEEGQMMEEPSA